MNRRKTEDVEPSTLYHYTTFAGLHGILASKEIWATSVRYLNDASEYVYLYDLLFKRVLPNFFANDPAKGDRFLQSMVKELSIGFWATTFVTCFCDQPDLLSQWRGYGGGCGSGVALGFDRAILGSYLNDRYGLKQTDPSDPLSPPDFSSDGPMCDLQQCLYDERTQRNILNGALDAVTREGEFDFSASIYKSFCDLDAARFKHPSFFEENEWRIVYRSSDMEDVLKFRAGKSMLIPFVEIDIGEMLPGALKKVVLGPSPHIEEAKTSVGSLLSQQGLTNAVVVASGIPFRSW